MNNVIEVLVQMASNAKMDNKQYLNEILTNAHLTKAQDHAIQTNNVDALKKVTYDLPEIKCYPILLPEDKNEEVITLINRDVVNF